MIDIDNVNDIARMYPPPEPANETPVPENSAFVRVCMSIAAADAEKLGWRLGESVLTRSDVWGFVLRIDVQSKHWHQTSKSVMRLIYWSGDAHDTVAGTAFVPCRFGL